MILKQRETKKHSFYVGLVMLFILTFPFVTHASLAPASTAAAERVAYVLQVSAIVLFLLFLVLLIRFIIKRNETTKSVRRSRVAMLIITAAGALLLFSIPITDWYLDVFKLMYPENQNEQAYQNKIENIEKSLDPVFQEIPEGWDYAVDPTDIKDYCNQVADFSIQFTYRGVECTWPDKALGTWTGSPSMTLSFYEKFQSEDWKKHNDCVETLRKFPIAAGAPTAFTESEDYTIMISSSDSCPEKDTSEIESYLKSYYE